MDKEHKEELQQSDLAEAIKNWKELWAKYGTHVLMAVLIVLAVVVFMRWYGGRETRMLEEAYGVLADSATPRGKQEAAAEFSHVPGFAGQAKLQAADLTLRQALNLTAQPGSAPTPAPTPEEMKSKLNDAAGLYQDVIKLNGSPLQVINAQFGLASVHESLGNFDKAAAAYDAAVAAAGDKYPHLADTAKRLKGELARISVPVKFAKPKPIVTPEPTTPGTGDAPSILDPEFKPDFGNTPTPDEPDEPDAPDTADTPSE